MTVSMFEILLQRPEKGRDTLARYTAIVHYWEVLLPNFAYTCTLYCNSTLLENTHICTAYSLY